MIRNLEINSTSNKKVKKASINKVISEVRRELNFRISSLIINFISSEEITQINKKHLKHNYSTDIITFDYSNDKENLDGEIFISVNDAEFNAIKYGVNFNKEVMRLIVHGILHLTGYDDKEKPMKIRMKRKEESLLKKIKWLQN